MFREDIKKILDKLNDEDKATLAYYLAYFNKVVDGLKDENEKLKSKVISLTDLLVIQYNQTKIYLDNNKCNSLNKEEDELYTRYTRKED